MQRVGVWFRRIGSFVGVLILVATVGFSGGHAKAQEPLVLYDDFNSPRINANKWLDGGVNGLPNEIVRAALFGKLNMFIRAYGRTDSDSDITDSRLRLSFANPPAVTAIKTTTTVKEFELVACPTNPDPALAGVNVSGDFFNAVATSADPDDLTNDVFAVINLQRESNSTDPGIFQVRGSAFQCTDRDCDNNNQLFAGVFLGFAALNRPATLLLQWDSTNHTFIFGLDGTLMPRTYSVSDTAAPTGVLKRLLVRLSVPNCTAATRPMASIATIFDNVFVNASAVASTSLAAQRKTELGASHDGWLPLH